jgi:general secretion pathway protein A
MYQQFYRLREEPFSITPDPRFLYLTDRHREAMEVLLYGIRSRKGFLCLTGEVGAGKTTLCRTMLSRFDETVHTALILNPMLSQTQFLRAVVREFSIEGKCHDRLSCLNRLNEFLLEVDAKDHIATLIIDEAQDMPSETLELARLLSNLETHSRKLLQIVLVGQSELRDRLRKESFRQLAQRITVRYHLGNMTPQETQAYLAHRLSVAAGGEDVAGIRFDESAVEAIHKFSNGTPRLVNVLGDKALLAGYVYQADCIDGRIVEAAESELKEAC